MRMIDLSLGADAIAAGTNMPTYVPDGPHTLANLGEDLMNTIMVASLGLVGAYVTQGTEVAEEASSRPDSQTRRRQPRFTSLTEEEDVDFFY